MPWTTLVTFWLCFTYKSSENIYNKFNYIDRMAQLHVVECVLTFPQLSAFITLILVITTFSSVLNSMYPAFVCFGRWNILIAG